MLKLVIEDSAGQYHPASWGHGLGMSLVDLRIKIPYGPAYGLEIDCEPAQWTRVTIRLPLSFTVEGEGDAERTDH